jgi:aminopeptidase N
VRARTVRGIAALAAVTALAAGAADGAALAPPRESAGSTPHFHPGAPGVGDPYFPLLGNGGFDVRHYDLRLRYRPAKHYLAGTDTVTARATTNLSRFDLDLAGMRVRSVRVGGVPATFSRNGPELRITPRHGLRTGTTFRVAVNYAGSPRTITGSPIVFGADYGWQYTKDGAFVGDEPNAARTWFPCSDHPSDKATYAFHITVPGNRQVVANGEPTGGSGGGSSGGGPGLATYDWRETRPMATYLATIDIGRWNFHKGRTPGGIPEIVAYDPALRRGVRRRHTFALSGRITDFWATTFGRYAFTSTGAIVDNVPQVGFSLETQTRPLYGFVPDPGTAAHELAHQWFGDAVSPRTWRDIWLNEGFATFAAAYWSEHTGGASTLRWARGEYRSIPAGDAFWRQSIADPKRPTMFSGAVYERGGMTLAALRHRIGSATFFRLLRRWVALHRYGNATTAQFVRLAERVSGRHLRHFFRIWLWRQRKPPSFTAG